MTGETASGEDAGVLQDQRRGTDGGDPLAAFMEDRGNGGGTRIAIVEDDGEDWDEEGGGGRTVLSAAERLFMA